jgi:dUTP pyrophosphatase
MRPVRYRLSPHAIAPSRGSQEAVGLYLYACLFPNSFILHPGQRARIPTGVSVEIPYGHEIQIRPRSGLAAKHGITVLNSPGTIDPDYRGEIEIILYNTSDSPFTIHHADRIAQMVICPVIPPDRWIFTLTDEPLKETFRGDKGFGSTG